MARELDVDLDDCTDARTYGGGPCRLADPSALLAACVLLLAGHTSRAVCVELGYGRPPSFLVAFRNVMGVTPGAYQRSWGVSPRVRRGGSRRLGRRSPPSREGLKTLPVFGAKRKAKKRKKKRKRRTKSS